MFCTALIEEHGGVVPDTREGLATVFDLAKGADVVVTLGGASVGDHDLVAEVGAAQGLTLDFYKIAMRPGKPLMAGRLGDATLLGLPGNPVSAFVCGVLFLRPLLWAAQGLPLTPPKRTTARLGADLGPNGPREHYMRASLTEDGGVIAADSQDSSLMSVLAHSDALIVRPPRDPAREAGDRVEIVKL